MALLSGRNRAETREMAVTSGCDLSKGEKLNLCKNGGNV
jgi:hypothetical protein